MKLFKGKEYGGVVIYGKPYVVEKEVEEYVEKLQKYINDLEFEKLKLIQELGVTKPILKSGDYKPAISRDCADCKYAARSTWNGDVLGCRKDNLCDDFIPVE